ncbi:Hypothetical predicted protein [Pelobates cultripes]|uniref:Uncharacterized protein n=1 Tax=Pelobates cultripes TaxID=61616 RepID=A0AAD1R7D9_PELCU|nr:Hypothetical predicted protein [Pelobates cultripes]
MLHEPPASPNRPRTCAGKPGPTITQLRNARRQDGRKTDRLLATTNTLAITKHIHRAQIYSAKNVVTNELYPIPCGRHIYISLKTPPTSVVNSRHPLPRKPETTPGIRGNQDAGRHTPGREANCKGIK